MTDDERALAYAELDAREYESARRAFKAACTRAMAYAKRARTVVAQDGAEIDAEYLRVSQALSRAELRANRRGVDTDCVSEVREEIRAARDTANAIFIADRRAKAAALRAR